MSGPHPSVALVRKAVRDALEGYSGLVVVACSGGADSLALAAATAFVAPRLGLQAGALVVDHGLQEGSPDVARRAARQCEGLGLAPVEVLTVEVGAQGGVESAAREARYRALRSRAAQLGAAAILLGHTLDDQAESVLLGLARGSGPRSIAGMAPRTGELLRPLLAIRRTQTEEVCSLLGLDPWLDPTNTPVPGASWTARRTLVRAQVMPVLRAVLGPGVDAALARTATRLRADDEALGQLAAQVLRQAQCPADPPAVLALDTVTLARVPLAVRGRALRAGLAFIGVPMGSVASAHIDSLEALVTGYHGQGAVDLPGGFSARRTCGTLVFLAAHTAADL